MKAWSNWRIRTKLFAIILLILCFNICLLLVAGRGLFERFYMSNKTAEIKESAQRIKTAYDQNSKAFYDEIRGVEFRNGSITLFEIVGDGSANITFHSRMLKERMRPEYRNDMPRPDDEGVEQFLKMLVELVNSMDRDPFIEVIDFNGDLPAPPQAEKIEKSEKTKPRQSLESGTSMLVLTTSLDGELYLQIQTPLEYIKSTADLAVQYTCIVSVVILLIGTVWIYILAGRVTKPISRIQDVADKIARLDFSERCEQDGGDELAKLSQSINYMSDKLQASISQLVAANEVLQSDLERQQKTDRMRRQFIANVSHDFKTPLTLIISYAEALMSLPDESARDEYADIIISEGNKLSGMVGRLLNLSKLESGVDSIEIAPFCLCEAVEEVTGKHKIITEKKRLSVESAIPPEIVVNADYYRIHQVITNLFENAVKYTADNGNIRVYADVNGENCTVSVENTGAHIDECDMENLFDSFYRADKSRTNSQNSFGIGLAVVKAVMEAHHRPYGVENIGDGVRFWFELECIPDDADDMDGSELDADSENESSAVSAV